MRSSPHGRMKKKLVSFTMFDYVANFTCQHQVVPFECNKIIPRLAFVVMKAPENGRLAHVWKSA
jgi:hypothetical protein